MLSGHINRRTAVFAVILLLLWMYVPRQRSQDEIMLDQFREAAKQALDQITADALNYKYEGASLGLPGWLQEDRTFRAPNNVSELFWDYYHEAMNDTKDVDAELASAQLSILFVGGIFTDYYPGYMHTNLARVRSISGLAQYASVVAINSVASVETNALVIRHAVIQEAARFNYTRKIILVGHSKGGVDVSAAVALYGEVARLVHCVVLLQAPYAGALMVTDLLAGQLRQALYTLVSAMGWDVAAMFDMTYEARKEFLKTHSYPNDVPTLCFASDQVSLLSPLAATHEYMFRVYSQANDGLVTFLDAVTSGCHLVHVHGADHGSPVFDLVLSTSPIAPGPFTLTMLRMALLVARRWAC
eukprot:TRINITY_DN11665_c0_g1_i1.p1 TRINITY_DN11665_c0_g1~~TRINITY_DN11665_c0_g1_i1.p1  ORF type:complete len:358 (-),score=60.82 TRINITY_DN11665_c0_g1_i1:213-1286(-)